MVYLRDGDIWLQLVESFSSLGLHVSFWETAYSEASALYCLIYQTIQYSIKQYKEV